MIPTDLATRPGLPDALRVLAERYPRDGWEGHRHFTPLTRFWLDRHLMFRSLQARLLAQTQGLLDRKADPRGYAADLARTGSTFVGELHGHHNVEDAHYFPLLRSLDPRLEAGFDLLDRDHQALDGGLHRLTEAANATLRALAATPADIDAAGRLKAELDAFARFLDRHLTDEEELVVPVILDHAGAGL